jgi:hypothetical protein
VVNGLASTCESPICRSWERPHTATGAYGTWCKLAHTVHVVNNFYFNFNSNSHVSASCNSNDTSRAPFSTEIQVKLTAHHH